MDGIHFFGKILIIFGLICIVVGVFFVLAPKIPWLGRLPGDIMIKRENFTFYFPLTTSIIASVVLSVILILLNRK
ncbi:MAG: DUF2905 domain-containing protein [Candidatus Omnitrophica bacterium]|nr:DUF2905 domain-containing protein [Candidatus Omnitrophota bacterium]